MSYARNLQEAENSQVTNEHVYIADCPCYVSIL